MLSILIFGCLISIRSVDAYLNIFFASDTHRLHDKAKKKKESRFPCKTLCTDKEYVATYG